MGKYQRGGKSRTRIAKIMLGIVLVCLPIIVLAIQSIFYNVNMFENYPRLSDEYGYWRELFSFSENGLDFGHTEGFYNYFAKIGPFGSHGLSVLLAYGWYGLLFSVQPNAIVIANIIMLMGAMLIFVCLVKLTIVQQIVIIILFLSYPPLALYLGTSMMEMPCYAALIGYVAVFLYIHRKLAAHKKVKLYLWILLFALGIYACFLRVCYAVILFPAILMLNNWKYNKKTIVSIILYVLGTGILYYAQRLFTGAYPYGYLAELSSLTTVREKLHSLWEHFWMNLLNYLEYEDNIQTAQRYFLLILIVAFCWWTVLEIKKGKKERAIALGATTIATIGLVAAICAFYDVFSWRDYRTLSPVAFVLVLIIVVQAGNHILKRTVYLILIAFLLFGIANIQPFYITETETIEDRTEEFSTMMENERKDLAITIDVKWDMSLMISIPSKIGISRLASNGEINTCKADYLLVGYSVGKNEWENYKFLGEIRNYGYIYEKKSP